MTTRKNPTGTNPARHFMHEKSPVVQPTNDDSALHEDDLRLMQQVAAGDERARREVAHRLVHRVRRLAKMMLVDHAMADDAAQNALIEILHSARTYGGRSSLERWADRIAARTAIRQRREQRRHDVAVGALANSSVPESISVGGGLREATPRPLEEYLGELPEPQREALVLKHSLEYTTEEIAELTGTAVGTVKDRLVTARRQLRKMIHRDLALAGRKAQS